MTFSHVLAEWEKWDDHSVTGALVFCDWCQDQNVSEYWVENWRQWLKFSGDPAWLAGELRRLVKCEDAADKKRRRTFSARLKALREKAGLTVADLASATGVSRTALYNLEGGKCRPTWDVVQRLANALGVTTDQFRDHA